MHWKPSFKNIGTPTGRFTSLRWFKTGWDTLYVREKYFFIQIGNNPTKYLYIRLQKKVKTPRFMMSQFWKKTFNNRYFTSGTTTRPKNFSEIWRTQDGISAGIREHDQGQSVIPISAAKSKRDRKPYRTTL